MCDLSNLVDIDQVGVRISQNFDEDRFSVRLNSLFEAAFFIRINECRCDAVIRKCMLQQIVCSTVDRLGCYDVISCVSQVLQRVGNSCGTRCHSQSCNTAFQSCQSLFENVLCGVCQSAVDVTCVCQSESCCRMIGIAEHVRCCLIDRNCSCVRCRIRRFLSDMQLLRFKCPVFCILNICHCCLPLLSLF